MKRTLTAISVLALLAVPALGQAHGGGAELSATVGDYLVELSSDALQPVAGVDERYNFDLWSATSSENMEGRYDRVWVRVMKGDTLYFSTWLAKPTGLLSGFTFAFPESGRYEVMARFMTTDGVPPEANFTLDVAPGERALAPGPSWAFAFLLSGGAFVIGALMAKRYVAKGAPAV